jgi:two-component system LytT family sensor kinase
MKKSMIFLIQAIFWMVFACLLFIILAAATNGFTAGPPLGRIAKIGISFIVVPSMVSFYLFHYFLFPRFITKRKIAASFLVGMGIAVFASLVGALTMTITVDKYIMISGGIPTFFDKIAFMTVINALVGLLSIGIKGFTTWFGELKLKEALLEKNHEMELQLVKSQLDPHFLFNTINNIDVLILKDAALASNYLNKLSDILRFMLFETKTDKIPLETEIEYIEKYIALQKIRTSNEQFVQFTVSGNPAKQQIVPLVFIPFIENAFKHVSNKKAENAINIQLQIDADKILFTCENKTGNQFSSTNKNSGLGNELIKKRLDLIYPETHHLKLENKEDKYVVKLSIKHD